MKRTNEGEVIMKNHSNDTQFVKVDLLDVLLDENNTAPIYLYSGDNRIAFEQVAVIPFEDKLYCILKPIDHINGVAKEEAIVFLVSSDNNGDSVLEVETDEDTAIAVFEQYYDLIEENALRRKRNS